MGAIEKALVGNGNVIDTGCLGTKAHDPRQRFPSLLEVIGRHVRDDVIQAVHRALPSTQEPFESLRSAGGIKLTTSHNAHIKIAEGYNHRCTFCIIHSRRGRLVSRPISDVVRLTNSGALQIDDWAGARITDSNSHDLTARVVSRG